MTNPNKIPSLHRRIIKLNIQFYSMFCLSSRIISICFLCIPSILPVLINFPISLEENTIQIDMFWLRLPPQNTSLTSAHHTYLGSLYNCCSLHVCLTFGYVSSLHTTTRAQRIVNIHTQMPNAQFLVDKVRCIRACTQSHRHNRTQ